jgi:hypothetical protein
MKECLILFILRVVGGEDCKGGTFRRFSVPLLLRPQDNELLPVFVSSASDLTGVRNRFLV